MVEEDLGEATIVYDDPDEGTIEETVPNEHVAYFQDHWIIKTGEDDRGRDTVRRVPLQRVHYVERTVEEFEQEVSTLRDQVQSVADDLRTKLMGGGERESGQSEALRIDVESGEKDEDADGEDRSA
ncbi:MULTISPECIES: hypothetical protein [Halorussus]|uniref:hypothetical protein n=1 Tax=Halorussus TaxID=1070314 RepID=UPI00209D37AB|nr:hypothetical protein [Halorussus vallis]USZ74680.1 hypothetical protein NGM07_14695 [Halorussus vallis]